MTKKCFCNLCNCILIANLKKAIVVKNTCVQESQTIEVLEIEKEQIETGEILRKFVYRDREYLNETPYSLLGENVCVGYQYDVIILHNSHEINQLLSIENGRQIRFLLVVLFAGNDVANVVLNYILN